MPEWLTQIMSQGNNPHRALEQFQNLHLPAFKRGANPLQAEKSLLQIEKILDVMDCSEDQRVSLLLLCYKEKRTIGGGWGKKI